MKKKNILFRLLSLAAVLAMVAVMTFSLASCGSDKEPVDTNDKIETPADSGGDTEKLIAITVDVIHADGSTKSFDISCADGATLRAALESVDLIEGDEGPFGLYVKVVDGERADYDADGAYWGFTQNGEYMMSGVDTIFVKDGDRFEIKYTKS